MAAKALHVAVLHFPKGAVPLARFDDFVLETEVPSIGRQRLHLYGRALQHQGQPTGRVQRMEKV